MAPSSDRTSEQAGVEPPLQVMLSKFLSSTLHFHPLIQKVSYGTGGNKQGPALTESTLQ